MCSSDLFNCSASNMVSDSARKAADKRSRIANYYVDRSDLQVQMYTGADWYNTYGMLIGRIDMDYENNEPTIQLINPFGAYPEIDRFGRVLSLTQIVGMDAESLASMFPEHATRFLIVTCTHQVLLTFPLFVTTTRNRMCFTALSVKI